MICNSCIKKDVCKHKEYFDKYCGLELSKCKYKKVEGSADSTVESNTFPNISVTHLEKPKRPQLSREEVNEKILELSKKQQKEPAAIREMKSCEICGEVDFKDQMHKCSKCGKWICSNCLLELPTLGIDPYKPMETKVLCDNCWSQEGQNEDSVELETKEGDNKDHDK